MLIRFDDTDAAIEIPDDPEFAGALRAAAFDWPFREIDAAVRPITTVRKCGEHYELSAPGEETIDVAVASAACGVIVDAVKAQIDAKPERLCFHCGTVEFAGRLVMFPGRFRAGKSTLVARLAFSGYYIFGDDVLQLDGKDERGIASGIAPRLRVPLPETASADFRAFAERHATVRDDRYLYLNPSGALAARGRTAPLGAVVLLDRREDGPAKLFHASHSAALQSLISRNFARASAAGELLERLHRVTEQLPCFTLRYSSLEEAAELLERTFTSWPLRTNELDVADPPLGEDTGDAAWVAVPVSRHARMQQNPSVRLREVEGELFLADAEGWGIHHLNAVGAGIWRLLAEPLSAEEATQVLLGAFPDASREAVERDVSALFSALAAEGFVIEAAESSDCA